jgi:lipid-A-disaccharide synthase
MSEDQPAPVLAKPAEEPPDFYFVAGEESGDQHAAHLWSELKTLYPKSKAYGVGGEHLRNAGQHQLFDLAQHAVVGLTEVLKSYLKFKRLFDLVVHDIIQKKPRVLILVDYPGFNLRLAERIRKSMPNLTIVYYIGPQVWAWKAGRSRQMKRLVDLLLVIFQFEKDWYALNEPDLKVDWVGHPIMDRWLGPAMKEDLSEKIHQVVLMPGSRRKEIETHLPILARSAHKASVFLQGAKFLILATDDSAKAFIINKLGKMQLQGFHPEVVIGYQLTHLSRADLALVASGTATVECGIAGVPMLVVYKTNALTYEIGKRVVKLPYLSMVNVLAGEKIVPEFLQERASENYLVPALKKFWKHPKFRAHTTAQLHKVAAKLGKPGASRRAAYAIEALLKKQNISAAPQLMPVTITS